MNYSTSWDSRNVPGRAICIFESLSRNPEHRKEILGGGIELDYFKWHVSRLLFVMNT